ncbi:MAG: hypothetical protein AAFY57_19440, partial [Cyanobacteria bacterium J06642_2]
TLKPRSGDGQLYEPYLTQQENALRLSNSRATRCLIFGIRTDGIDAALSVREAKKGTAEYAVPLNSLPRTN